MKYTWKESVDLIRMLTVISSSSAILISSFIVKIKFALLNSFIPCFAIGSFMTVNFLDAKRKSNNN